MIIKTKNEYTNIPEDTKREELKLISGNFLEGEYVTVMIDGNQVSRKVFFRKYCELFITYKNKRYYQSDFM